jgi:hypothetical protein
MIARGTELAVTLVVLGSALASGLVGVASSIAPGDGAGAMMCWFLPFAMPGGGVYWLYVKRTVCRLPRVGEQANCGYSGFHTAFTASGDVVLCRPFAAS